MKNKNILEFCLSPDLGGLEMFMVECFYYFRQHGSCKVVIAPNKRLDNYIDSADKFYLHRNKLFPLIPALKLAKYIDKNEIDIIHFHWTRDIATVVLGKLLSKRNPQIMQTRNMSMTRFKNDFYHKWLYKNITTMHSVTYAVKEQIEKFIPPDVCPNVEVVYMGTKEQSISLSAIESLKDKYQIKDEFIIGIVGRIEEAKGQYLVIEALAKLKNKNIKVMIVGHTMDNQYLSNLKQKIKNLGIEDSVIFTGFTKQVNEHLKLFDVNILATPKETFGLVVIEAMMNRVCMIATNKGGPLEIINDKQDGLLFDRTTEDLVDKIKLLVEDRELKERLAFNGYKKAREKFNNDIQLEKLYGVINGS